MGEGLYIYICGFGEGGVHTFKQTFLQKVAASLVKVTASNKQMSP